MEEFRPFSGSSDFLSSTDATVSKHAQVIYKQLCAQALLMRASPLTHDLVERTVLSRDSLSAIVAAVLAEKINAVVGGASAETSAFEDALLHHLSGPRVVRCLVSDLYKMISADPAVDCMLPPLLFFKGFHALSLHRVAHQLWVRDSPGDRLASLRLQSIGAGLFSVDIHPGAEIGPGVMIDHASGVVIGGTAVVGSDTYMLHSVTLGATGKPARGGRRHPTIRDGVTLGAGATILGDIVIGTGVSVGAHAVVTRPVPAGCTVVGVNKVLSRHPSSRSQPPDRQRLGHAAEQQPSSKFAQPSSRL
jgi:serine O-acetyltransferase